MKLSTKLTTMKLTTKTVTEMRMKIATTTMIKMTTTMMTTMMLKARTAYSSRVLGIRSHVHGLMSLF